LRDVGIAGVSDGFSGIQLTHFGRMRAIQLGGANFQRPAANELLSRIKFAGFEESHQQERFQRRSRRFQTKARLNHAMRGQDGSSCDVYDDESSGQFPHGSVHFALQVRFRRGVV